MNDTWRTLVSSTIVCFLVAFGILLLVSMITFPADAVIGQFQWEWIFSNTWAQLLRLAPVAQAWAVLLVFAWIVPSMSSSVLRGGGTSFDRFGSSLIALLAMTVVFTVMYLVFYPQAHGADGRLVFTSSLARSLQDSSQEAEDDQDYDRAYADLSQYANLVDSEDPELQIRLRRLRDQVELDSARRELDGVPTAREVLQNASLDEIIDRALAARQREDYSTAHYMATLVLTLDPDDPEATRIAAESLQRLSEVDMSATEEQAATLFSRKLQAKRTLSQGDVIGAYYQLAALEEEAPRDTDVQRYLAAATEQLTRLAVFHDEVIAALARTGTEDVAFVNRRTPDFVELVYIGKLVNVPSGIYAQRVEAIRVTPDGRVLRQLVSDYGKLDADHLILQVIDRDEPDRIQLPEYFAGDPGDETRTLLQIGPAAGQLWLIASAVREPESASIGEVVRALEIVEQFGLMTTPLHLALILRFVAPFTYLILGIFSMGFAWRYRSRYLGSPPVIQLVVIPVIPLLLVPAFLALAYAQRIIVSLLLVWGGLAAAIILAVAIQAVLLGLSLGYLALSTSE